LQKEQFSSFSAWTLLEWYSRWHKGKRYWFSKNQLHSIQQ